MIPRRQFALAVTLILFSTGPASSQDPHHSLPVVTDADVQPLLLQSKRLREALSYLGQPLPQETIDLLDQARKSTDDAVSRKLVQQALDPHCLFGVNVNPESRVKVVQGPAETTLTRNGWTQFLVKVHNEAGVTAPLRATSPNTGRVAGATTEKLRDLWLDMNTFDQRPLPTALTGTTLEYRIIQLFSRDVGKRSAVVAFDVGQGTQDIGFRNDVVVTFDCRESVPVTFRIRDENHEPSTACFVIRDQLDRVYPAQSKRLAPDFAFHPQIYRHDGETIHLPSGEFKVAITRGPEYLTKNATLKVGDQPVTFPVELRRWVDPAAHGWWSGDHHIHAAGCAHYSNPTEGVHAPDMMRHCLGEDLKVGCNLTWGPCFDYQKQFFTGKIDEVSRYPYLLRYDVEVSGFGSHNSGHLCLLRLKQQIPTGGDSKHHWPKLCLNTLRWAKKQGAVCGPAHSGWGLSVPSTELPNYEIPPFNSIGANEYIVDVTHTVEDADGEQVPAVDFISMVDTPHVWELNIWYHTLNCGFRTRISGETDFPCIYGERVGLGRSYVKLDGKLDFDSWCEGIRRGAAYVGDGRSHLIDFRADDLAVGQASDLSAPSELRLDTPKEIAVSAKVAAFLPEKSNPGLRKSPYTNRPYWHVERARVDDSRKVKVELIINGLPADSLEIEADGELRDVQFRTKIERSSWVAIRILPSSHTNPIFVVVNENPIRASRRSAKWCLDGVKKCRGEKRRFMDDDEVDDFNRAYDHAAAVYEKVAQECEVD